MDKLLEDMVKSIVDKPDEVKVVVNESDSTKIFELAERSLCLRVLRVPVLTPLAQGQDYLFQIYEDALAVFA